MSLHIKKPSIVTAAGNKPKKIEEFFGRVNSNDASVSIARMKSPAGWKEPGQTPKFDEYSLVLNGVLKVETKGGIIEVGAGEGILIESGKWVQYSTPDEPGAEYIAVCIPAFSPELVHRDE